MSLSTLKRDREAPEKYVTGDGIAYLNYYKKIPKTFLDTQHVEYKNESTIQIKIPTNWCLCGATGSGKTNSLFNIIKNINAFTRFYFYVKDVEEPLYRWFLTRLDKLSKKTKKPLYFVQTSLKNIPTVDELDKKYSNLVVFDDMISEPKPDQRHAEQYFIRGRKLCASSMYLSQNYYSVPTVVRRNCQYFVFTKIAQRNDLMNILREFSLGITIEQLYILFKIATQGHIERFFLIDMYTLDDKLRFRQNFQPMEWKKLLGIPEDRLTEQPEWIDKEKGIPASSSLVKSSSPKEQETNDSTKPVRRKRKRKTQ